MPRWTTAVVAAVVAAIVPGAAGWAAPGGVAPGVSAAVATVSRFADAPTAGVPAGVRVGSGTVAFYAVGSRSGRVVAVTAGHVAPTVGGVLDFGGSALTTASTSATADVAALGVRFRPDGTFAVNDGAALRRVVGTLPVSRGLRVCAAGSTSAEACGVIDGGGDRFGVASLAGRFVTGSSGGPVYAHVPGEDGVRLLGLLVGSNLAEHSTVMFVPVEAAVRSISADLGEPFAVVVAAPIRPSLTP